MKSVVYRNVVEEIEYLSTNTFKDIEPYNQNEAYKAFSNHFPNYLKEENMMVNSGNSFTQYIINYNINQSNQLNKITLYKLI